MCAPHTRGGSSTLGPETPHWLCHRPTRLHTCSMAIPAGWESDWACTCTCTHIDATHATFISSRWSSHDFVHSSPVLNPGCDPMCLARQVRVADRDYKLSGSCASWQFQTKNIQMVIPCFRYLNISKMQTIKRDPPQGSKKGPARGTLKDHRDQKKGDAES